MKRQRYEKPHYKEFEIKDRHPPQRRITAVSYKDKIERWGREHEKL